MTVAELSPITWVQRLGYVFKTFGSEEIWQPLGGYVNAKNPVRSPLLPSATIKSARLNKLWQIYIDIWLMGTYCGQASLAMLKLIK